MTIEEAIAQLELDIKRLKVQYDMFLSGAMPRQPYELRKQVDQSIRAYSHASIRKYHHRFMLNTLVGRYNTLCEQWAKQLRAMEEGGRASAVQAILHRGAPPPPRRRLEDEVCFAVKVSNPEAEPEAMRALYDQFLQARTEGAGQAPIRLESFVRQVAQQAATLKESAGCESIEFRVLRRGETVSLKARVAK